MLTVKMNCTKEQVELLKEIVARYSEQTKNMQEVRDCKQIICYLENAEEA